MWALPRGRNRVFKGNHANCAPKMVLSGSNDLPNTRGARHDRLLLATQVFIPLGCVIVERTGRDARTVPFYSALRPPQLQPIRRIINK